MMGPMTSKGIAALVLAVGMLAAWVEPAAATIPECRGMRIDADASCELRGFGNCASTCDVQAMWRACASDLAATCQGSCNLSAETSCSGDCGSTCETRCQVEDLVCESGCIDECSALCDDQCPDGDDQCLAACEATCDVDCDAKCAELPVDAKCYEHCNQCCVGMCTAKVNFDCQLDCQKPDFSNCADKLVDECAVSCGTEGALFCDGDFVAGGADLKKCLAALLSQKVSVEEDFSVRASLDSLAAGCSAGGSGGQDAWFAALALLPLIRRRRR